MAEMITESGFEFQTEEDGSLSVTRYLGKEVEVTVPAQIGGLAVSSLAERAFEGCGHIMAASLPATIKRIAPGAFDRCGSLVKIKVDPDNADYSTSDGVLYNKEGDVLIRYPPNKPERNCIIPERVKHIGDGAFAQCTGFSTIMLPGGLLSIGREGFAACKWLAYIRVPEDCLSIGAWAFSGCWKLTNAALPPLSVIEQGTFSYCGALPAIRLPDGVRVIGEDAFSCCNGLAGVVLPDSLVYIGERAFYECRSLAEVRLPLRLEAVGEGAFYGCGGLRKLTLSQSVRIGAGAFPDTATLAYRG